MAKYVVETFYTCTFKIVHKLDELNEKKLSELENRNDGEFQIIDVKLNNRKTRIVNKENNLENSQNKTQVKDAPKISSIIKEKIEIFNNKSLSIYYAAFIGALTFSVTDSQWFNAVEAEVYALSTLFTAIVVWLILKWAREKNNQEKYKYLS